MYCGTRPNSASLHLKLTDVKLPTIEEIYIDHRAGGAPVAVEIDVMMAKLSCEFTILGLDIDTLRMIRPVAAADSEFHVYGLIHDTTTGVYAQAAATLVGRLGNMEPGVYRRETALRTHYGIRGVSFYQLVIAGELIYYWDFFGNRFVIGQN